MTTSALSRKANDLKNRVRNLKNATSSGTLTPQQMISLVGLLSETLELVDELLNKNTDVQISGAKIVGGNLNKARDN